MTEPQKLIIHHLVDALDSVSKEHFTAAKTSMDEAFRLINGMVKITKRCKTPSKRA